MRSEKVKSKREKRRGQRAGRSEEEVQCSPFPFNFGKLIIDGTM